MEKRIVSDGTAEDMIRAFVQVGCAEVHVKTLVEKYNAEMENGMVDISNDKALNDAIKKLDEANEELNELAETRRGIMLALFNMYHGNKDYWCVVKHLGIGAYTLFEAYQASDDDPELYTLALETNKRFVKALTHFLGVEITDCAACFSDMMRGEVAHGERDLDRN